MNRGNMGKKIATAPKSKSKKVKKMMYGGTASVMPNSSMSIPRPSSPPTATNVLQPMTKEANVTMSSMGPESLRGNGRIMQNVQDARKMQAMPMPAPAMTSRPMKKGGAVKKMAKGGATRADGIVMKGKTKGKMC